MLVEDNGKGETVFIFAIKSKPAMNTNPSERGTAQIPIDAELQSILLQFTNSREHLNNYLQAIRDRHLFDLIEDEVGKVNDDLVNAITGLSMVLADRMSYQIIENK